LVTLGAGAWLLTGCAGGPPAGADVPPDVGPSTDDPVVAVVDNDFGPVEVVVATGAEVTWHWEGRAAHDVVGDGFESDIQATGTFTHAFDGPGAYAYVCTLHPGMEGVVYVVPDQG
jgi:plastocyanin